MPEHSNEPVGEQGNTFLASGTSCHLTIETKPMLATVKRTRFGIFMPPLNAAATQNAISSVQRNVDTIRLLDDLGYDVARIGEHHEPGAPSRGQRRSRGQEAQADRQPGQKVSRRNSCTWPRPGNRQSKTCATGCIIPCVTRRKSWRCRRCASAARPSRNNSVGSPKAAPSSARRTTRPHTARSCRNNRAVRLLFFGGE